VTTALLRRLLAAIPTVLLVLTVTFAALHLAPGDPVRLYLGPDADEAAAQAMRRQLGLERTARSPPSSATRWHRR